MVSEMAQKPLKYEEHIYSKLLTPKNKNGQKHPILGHIDGGVPLIDSSVSAAAWLLLISRGIN